MYNAYYNPQASIDRINNQIAELEKMKTQLPQTPIQQPTNLTQNFQLTPQVNNNQIRYASNIDEVKRDLVIGDTPYFAKDMSVLWVKNTQGTIKTYELNELVEKDEKDVKIEFLMAQINELKKGLNNEQHNTDVDESIKDEKSTSVSTISKSSKKSK